MKRNIIILFVLFSFILNAQVVIIKDSETKNPIEFVTIKCLSSENYILTNEQGKADISSLNCKEYEINILGYKKLKITHDEIVKQSFQIIIEKSPITLDQVVVSAVKWRQNERTIPLHITKLDYSTINYFTPQTSADMIGYSGEVFIQKSQQGGGSPMLRGFATNRVLITVDGVRMNTAIFRGGNVHNIISIDPYSVDNTEILFGPGSVVYGSDAIGGVMNINTLPTQYSDNDKLLVKGSVSMHTATANKEKTGHVDFNLGWKKFSMLTSYTFNDFGDLRMGTNGPDEYLDKFYVQTVNNTDYMITNRDSLIQKPTGYSQNNFMQKFSFKPNDKLEFKYNFIYTESSNIPRYDRLIRTKNGLPRSAEWYYGPQIWMQNKLNIESKHTNVLYNSMIVNLAYQHFEESRIDRNFNKPTRFKRYEEVEAISATIDFNKNLGEKDEIFYGIDLVYNKVNSTGIDENISTGIENIGPSRYPDSDWGSYAAYVTYNHKFSNKISFMGGARYNQYMLNAVFDTTFYPFPFTSAKINNGAITGSMGLNYSPNPKWIFSANLSTGFRSPNIDDVGKVFDSEPGSVVVPNPDLKAEYAYNAEGSIEKIFGEILKLQLTGYYIYLDNALVRRDFKLNGLDSIMYSGEMSKVQAIQNAAFAVVYGLQAGIEAKLPSGFGIFGRFNYQKGIEELEDGTTSPLRHAAPWYGMGSMFYNKGQLRADFYVNFSGEVSYENMPQEEISKNYMYAEDENGNPYSPSWYTINFRIAYKFNHNLTINAGVENILDIRYRPYSSGIVAPGRNLIVGVKSYF